MKKPKLRAEDIVHVESLSPGDKSLEIVRLKLANPNLTQKEIGKLVGRERSSVCKCLKRYGVDIERVNSYRKLRADILATKQGEILEGMTPEKIEKASLKDSSVAFAILYDKERLETGQSTQNVALSKIVMDLDKENSENSA